MRVIYMGTPDFAVPALKTLSGSKHEITAVFSQPDKPVGRHSSPVPTPVKEAATELGIKVFQPEKIRDEKYIQIIKQLAPDVIVVAAFGQIIPVSILETPRYGCINIHASLLPKYRGAAPIQWALLDGEKETGITIMQMNEGLDTGDIILQEKTAIRPDETCESLFDRLSGMGGDMVLKVLESFEKGTASKRPQSESNTSYARMIKKEMGNIDWTESAETIERKVRAFYPWPGAYTFLDGRLVKIWKSCFSDKTSDLAPGTILPSKDELLVVTGRGLLSINELQLTGKKRMPAKDFLRGIRLGDDPSFKSV